jgi:hypothetical protein
LHQTGNEQMWWRRRSIDALKIANSFWMQTRPSIARSPGSNQGTETAET